MYDYGLLNSFLFDAKSRISSFLGSTDAVIFNGYGIQNENIIISDIIIGRSPSRDFQTTKIPNDHGRIINKNFYDKKTIRLRGVIRQGAQGLFETLRDKVMKNLSAESGNLDIQQADGTYRRFVCTATDINIKRDKHYNITYAPFEVTFECLVPFGQSVTEESLLFSVTDLIFNENIYNSGSAESKPIWIMIVTADDSITGFNVKNNDTGEEVEVTTAVVASDVIIINCEEKFISKNGVNLDYNGKLPKLLVGSNGYTITCTGTSIAYSLTQRFTPFFL